MKIPPIVVFWVFLTLPFFGNTQVKKNLFGIYTGEIQSYEMRSADQFIAVASTTISVEIDKSAITVTVGKQQLKGEYTILLEKKEYFVLVGKMEGQLAEERIVLYKKGKRMIREGITPQPDAVLRKK